MIEAIKSHFQTEIFHGTTQENFLQGAYIKDQSVIFDHDRITNASFAGTYLVRRDIAPPVRTALQRALKLNHTPLVFSTILWNTSIYLKVPHFDTWVWLPPGTSANVARLWIPKNEQDWKKKHWSDMNDDQAISLFEEHSPITFLQELKIQSTPK